MISYSRHHLDQSDIDAVVDVLNSNYLTQGSKVCEFEEALAQYTGAKYAVAVSSGTAALHLAALAMGMEPGKIGVTSPITFAASANCFLYAGADVKFTDVDPITGLMCLQSLEETVQSCPNPGLIIPVSLQGRVPQLEKIQSIAKKYSWLVLEDAAHSLGATYSVDNKIYKSASCSHTDAAILSFHPVKHITTGEGGAFLTNSKEFADKVRLLRSHGIVRPQRPGEPSWYYEQTHLGYNYRLTDIQAALGASQLKRLPLFLEKRRQIASFYRDHLSQEPFTNIFKLSPPDPGHSYHLFVLMFLEENIRNEAHEYLKSKGFFTQIHYVPIYKFPYYVEKYGYISHQGTEKYFQACLSISNYYIITKNEMEELISLLYQFANTKILLHK